MAKDVYWFKHDSNSRNDAKAIRLRRLAGWEGYGVFWGIIEMLREASNYRLPVSAIEDIAFDFGVDVKIVQEIFDADLLTSDGESFYSESLMERMNEWDAKKAKRIRAGRKGGKAKQCSSNAKAMLKQCSSNAKARREEKRREEYTSKPPFNPPAGGSYTPDFEAFWKAYPKKVGKGAAFRAWQKSKSRPKLDIILHHISTMVPSRQWTDENGKYIPNPATWINQCRWDDEPETRAAPAQPGETPSEAWESVLEYVAGKREADDMTPETMRALKAIGGSWEVRNAKSSSIMMAQFKQSYKDFS